MRLTSKPLDGHSRKKSYVEEIHHCSRTFKTKNNFLDVNAKDFTDWSLRICCMFLNLAERHSAFLYRISWPSLCVKKSDTNASPDIHSFCPSCPERPAAPIYERFTVQNFVLYHSEEIEVGQNMSKSWLLLRDVTNSDKDSTIKTGKRNSIM